LFFEFDCARQPAARCPPKTDEETSNTYPEQSIQPPTLRVHEECRQNGALTPANPEGAGYRQDQIEDPGESIDEACAAMVANGSTLRSLL